MALIAWSWQEQKRLIGDTVVATVMSNLGLERFLADLGIALLRTGVGDRLVVEAMRKGGYNLGGEQSGHIVLADYATTGDGMIAALQFLARMVETGKDARSLGQVFFQNSPDFAECKTAQRQHRSQGNSGRKTNHRRHCQSRGRTRWSRPDSNPPKRHGTPDSRHGRRG